jgi:hypothetical protein
MPVAEAYSSRHQHCHNCKVFQRIYACFTSGPRCNSAKAAALASFCRMICISNATDAVSRNGNPSHPGKFGKLHNRPLEISKGPGLPRPTMSTLCPWRASKVCKAFHIRDDRFRPFGDARRNGDHAEQRQIWRKHTQAHTRPAQIDSDTMFLNAHKYLATGIMYIPLSFGKGLVIQGRLRSIHKTLNAVSRRRSDRHERVFLLPTTASRSK